MVTFISQVWNEQDRRLLNEEGKRVDLTQAISYYAKKLRLRGLPKPETSQKRHNV